MASGGDEDEKKVTDELIAQMNTFCKLSGSKEGVMNPKACGKMAKDCFSKYKDMSTILDASVFPQCKEKGSQNMVLDTMHVDKFFTKAAFEVEKRHRGKEKFGETDAGVRKCKSDLIKCMMEKGPKVKTVKQSATGNVDAMTDTSKYTGSHKGRFDESGKGVGKKGRVDEVDNSGYVGNYKGAGTYGKK